MRFASIDIVELPKPWGREALQRLSVNGLHCGCGGNYCDGWLNIDREPFNHRDFVPLPHMAGALLQFSPNGYYLSHDMSHGLPFEKGSVPYIYSEHFIEHLPPQDGIKWLCEIKRILMPGGVARITMPDLEKFVHGFLDPAQVFYNQRRAIAKSRGNLNAATRRAQMLNRLFYSWGHRWLYDYEEFEWAAGQAGFPASSLVRQEYRQSDVSVFAALDMEWRSIETMYVELHA